MTHPTSQDSLAAATKLLKQDRHLPAVQALKLILEDDRQKALAQLERVSPTDVAAIAVSQAVAQHAAKIIRIISEP